MNRLTFINNPFTHFIKEDLHMSWSRLCLVCTIFLFVFVLSSSAEASYTENVAQKFSRGVGNVVYSPLEIPLQVSNEMNSDDYVYAIPKGTFRGLMYTVGRLGVGAYEVVTFPVPQKPIIPNFNQE